MAAAPHLDHLPQVQQMDRMHGVENFGNLNKREVIELRTACIEKHEDKGKAVNILLGLASLVVAVWIATLVGGFAGFLLGCTIHIILGNALSDIYNNWRNRDFLDIANSLKTDGFKKFLSDNHLDLSIDSIHEAHIKYKEFLAAQIGLIQHPA